MKAGDEVLGPQRRLAAAAPFGNEDVAVGQHQRLAGDTEAGGDCGDRIALRHRRARVAPGRRVGDLHRRKEAPLRRRAAAGRRHIGPDPGRDRGCSHRPERQGPLAASRRFISAFLGEGGKADDCGEQRHQRDDRREDRSVRHNRPGVPRMDERVEETEHEGGEQQQEAEERPTDLGDARGSE